MFDKERDIKRRKGNAIRRRRTSVGKEAETRYNQKQRVRRKAEGYQFHKISLPLNVPFVWHHVNKRDVVACPLSVHKFIYHVLGDGKIEGVLG